MKYGLRTFILAWLILSLLVVLPSREIFLASRDDLILEEFDKVGEDSRSRIANVASEENMYLKLFGVSRVEWLRIGTTRFLDGEIAGSISCEQLELLAELNSLRSLFLSDVRIEACTETKCRSKLSLDEVDITSTNVAEVKQTLKSLSLIQSKPVRLFIPKWKLTASEIAELENLPIVEQVEESQG